jgi:hypothetical protein
VKKLHREQAIKGLQFSHLPAAFFSLSLWHFVEWHPFMGSFALLLPSRGWNNKKVSGIMNMDAMILTMLKYKHFAGMEITGVNPRVLSKYFRHQALDNTTID